MIAENVGFNCQNNGDGLTARNLLCRNTRRSYFVYGCRDHWAEVVSEDNRTGSNDVIIHSTLRDTEDIELTFHDGVLTVSGERKRDLDDGVSFFAHERFYGVFRRNITLPAGVSDDDISAEFDNGLVEITVRDGAAGVEPRRIEIRNRAN